MPRWMTWSGKRFKETHSPGYRCGFCRTFYLCDRQSHLSQNTLGQTQAIETAATIQKVKTGRESGSMRVHGGGSPPLGVLARTRKLSLGQYREVLSEGDVEAERPISGLADRNAKA